MKLNDVMKEKIKDLWNKGYSMADIAWMLDISIIEVGEWVGQNNNL